MSLTSADIKRQILIDGSARSKRDDFRKKIQGIPEGEIIEMGNALEAMTKTQGWIYAESYLIRRMNLVGLVFGESDDVANKGLARGYIEFMQWVQNTILARDEILAKSNRETTEKLATGE